MIPIPSVVLSLTEGVDMAERWIYWLKEVGAEHNNIVGKKCANLGELTKAGFHVPLGAGEKPAEKRETRNSHT